MNTETLAKLSKMRLLGMHRAFKTSLETNTTEHLTADERATLLTNGEWEDRYNRSIDRAGSATGRVLSNWTTVPKGVWIKTQYTARHAIWVLRYYMSAPASSLPSSKWQRPVAPRCVRWPRLKGRTC